MTNYRRTRLKNTKYIPSSYRLDVKLNDKLAFLQEVSHMTRSKILTLALEEWINNELKVRNIKYIPSNTYI